MKQKVLLIFSVLLVVFNTGCDKSGISDPENQAMLSRYNITWDSPSEDYTGSMPLGNGDIGLNAWVEENGDISFFIGKTDSWGDNGQLLKVGQVRIKCEPSIIFPGAEFSQELDLLAGSVRISSKGVVDEKERKIDLKLWVDANNPVIHLEHESNVPVRMTAFTELWRTTRDTLTQMQGSDLLTNQPDSLYQPVIVEPDDVIRNTDDYIGWYHHNSKSVGFDITNRKQGLSGYYDEDPILHRTFGAIIKSGNSEKLNDTTLQIPSSESGRLDVYVLTVHPSTPEDWQSAIEDITADIEGTSFDQRRIAHEEWWKEFWNRSWIHAEIPGQQELTPDDDAFIVSRSYALQRFIQAGSGRGDYAIKFNGSIFTVPSEGAPEFADYRRWGPGYWWQNTRLPYFSMQASGDYDLLEPLFDMYGEDVYDLSKYRANKYFGFDGVYYPECITFWGAVFLQTYGWTPYEQREDKLQESRWHKWEWVCGPELIFMMMDYYDYSLDNEFLKQKLIPVANDVIKFFDNYYDTNDEGKLVMHPSQAVETWWECTNPMPELSGLYAVARRLAVLPENLTDEKDRKYWNDFIAKLPDIPLRETPSGKALAPAEKFDMKRNIENPELYAVFPFRLYGVGNPDIEHAKNALKHRWDKGAAGWRQDDIFMAYLGLTDEVKENIVSRSRNYDENMRFPAFWGPNYDWTPDQTHGGVLMKTFQSMLLQPDPYSEKIYIFPAWPHEWDVTFKLRAPKNTVIEASLKDGKLEFLNVTPKEREKDIIGLPEED